MHNTPVYIAPIDSPDVVQFRDVFAMYENTEYHTLTFDVHQDLVKQGEVAMLQELIIALQHYPNLIERFLFAIDFKFTEIEDSDIVFPESYWKTDPDYYQWFFKMSQLPIVIFFLSDEDARFYCLAGDFLAAKDVIINGGVDKWGKTEIAFTGEQVQVLMDRLFNACWFLLIYCHGSGFEPRSYIETIIAAFDFDISYEQVYEAYKKDIEVGIELRVRPS